MLKEFRTLGPYVKKYLRFYLVGLVFLVITDGGQMIIPQLIKRATDAIASGSFENAYIAKLMVIMAGAALAIAVGRFGWRYFINGSARRIEAALRQKLYDHLITLSSTFFKEAKTGDLMARFTNDLHHIRMAVGIALVALVDGIFMTIVILVILFAQYPQLALITVAPLPLVTIIVLGFGRLMGARFVKVQEGFSTLSEEVQESLSGIRVIKTFVRENHFLDRFKKANNEYLKRNLDLVKIWGLMFPVIGFLSGVTSLLLLYFGGERVLKGSLSPGDFVAFLSYLGMLIWPMIGAGFTVNVAQRGAVSLKRINKILNTEPDIISPPGAEPLPDQGILEVRNLSFAFPDSPDDDVLKDISFVLEQGKTLGILGATGSGKTTLLRLLPRLLDPPSGTVFYGGQDVRLYNLASLRSSLAMVPQGTFLFSTTIKENIAYGTPEAEDTFLEAMAEYSTISRDLKNFPRGWDSPVGEKGLTLSGGQKQRIAISRAMAVDPEILIFDDALSAVDTETEEKILNGFSTLRKGKTNILVSHRISTLEAADLVIVLEEGRIVQQGTPEDLKTEDGIFRRIHELQKLSEEEGIHGK